ncbi:MAG: hypothetical protein LUQ50_13555 [Methanospirillum sp.]|uniref:DUF166 family protein n=1 Tax=Methanospirillum sp. TaxID=45200 RepID=UPI0023745B09|nr:DUF166 family protein [Methanospirillum sp.]MDD1730082.1 hypothetical protein [Methanospirillum sp.]
MKIGIVSDGQYGERAFEQIRKRFSTEWILLPFPTSPVVDDIHLTIPSSDLYISYLRHPDIGMELVKTGVPVLLGVNLGPGFLAQALELNLAVIGPETMCSLLPNTRFWQINEYAKVFGRPVFHMILDGDRVVWCHPLRGSPCGSTESAALELNGKMFDQEALNQFALSICHNCRAPRFGRTCDKEKAGFIHLEELVSSMKGINPELWEKSMKEWMRVSCTMDSDLNELGK